MGLDIRWPIGLMFSLLGIMLVGYGAATGGDAQYEHSLNINVNLRWGFVLLVFGAWMLTMAWRGSKAPVEPAAPSK
jgi:hypothetical protein